MLKHPGLVSFPFAFTLKGVQGDFLFFISVFFQVVFGSVDNFIGRNRLRRTREEAERRYGYDGRCAPYAVIAFRPVCVHASSRTQADRFSIVA